MKPFNLSDWALDRRSLVWYFMIAFLLAGSFLLPPAWPRGRSELHHQDHGDPGQWPGASAAGDDAAGHRPDREEARRAGIARLHQERHRRRPDHGLRLSAATPPRRATSRPTWARVRNMIADIKGDFPQASSAGLQRSFRRRVRQYLRLHRRRTDPAAVARPGRRHPRARS